MQQRRTGKWFALTQYTVVRVVNRTGFHLAYKHRIADRADVTDQMRVILRADRKRRAA